MRKILVIGSGGSGKSTFSTRLGALLNIEVSHLDKFSGGPDGLNLSRKNGYK
jgi:adenylate kinase family enzyme